MAKSSRSRGLGKGFESLIPDVLEEKYDPTAGADQQVSHTRPIKIQDIRPNKDQPRKNFNDQAMQELVASIKTHGILQPIVVVRDGARYRLIAGERRWRAAQAAGHDTVPAIIRTLNDQQQLELSLIENLQREDLNPLEIATGMTKLIQQFNVTVNELSKRLGKAQPTVHNTIRLLQLPDPAKRALVQGRISEGHARAILMLSGDLQKQQQLLDYITRNKWSVRQAEQFAAAAKKHPSKDKAVAKTLKTNKDTVQLTKKIGAKTPVKIHNMAKGRGRIIIEFNDKKEYKKITNSLLK